VLPVGVALMIVLRDTSARNADVARTALLLSVVVALALISAPRWSDISRGMGSSVPEVPLRMRRSRNEWKEIERRATEMRLSLGAAGGELAGTVDGFPLEVRFGDDGLVSYVVRGLPDDVSLADATEPLARPSGDPLFDLRFRTQGNEDRWRAALDANTRGDFRRLAPRAATIRLGGGALSIVTDEIGDFERVATTVATLVSIATSLARPADSQSMRIEALATDDPEAGVREQCLRHLVRARPDALETKSVLAAACADRDAGVRLAAAQLAPDDVETESVLIALLASHAGDGAVRRGAVDQLGRAGTSRAVEPLLALTRGLLAGELGDAARAAIAAIQARIDGAGHGQLTVTTGGGELSETTGAGKVSIAPRKAETSR
jgi:hypothetical protein